MTRLIDLTVALSSYDHTADLAKGDVRIAGTRPDFVAPSEGIDVPRQWDVTEVPLVAYGMLRAAGDDALCAIPVFTSRMFPHRAIYVRGDRVKEPGDLRDARVGIISWSDTTAVWARGVLSDMYGVGAGDVDWLQGALQASGEAAAPATWTAPPGVSLRQIDGRGLEELLYDGELDALIATGVSERLRTAGPEASVRHLFDESTSAEREYYQTTSCLPPVRTVAVRREVVEEHPWIASNLYRAFEVSKRRYFVRLTEISASRTAIPWTSAYMTQAQALFGTDLWPYGVEGNRSSLEVFLRYGAEQHLFASELSVDELFLPVEPFVDGLI